MHHALGQLHSSRGFSRYKVENQVSIPSLTANVKNRQTVSAVIEADFAREPGFLPTNFHQKVTGVCAV